MAGFRLGSSFGVEITVDYSWFVLFALILWSFSGSVFPDTLPGMSGLAYLLMGLIAAVLFFASLLLHELSHALVARAKGIPVDGITLFIFGGVARTKMEAERPGDEFQIAGVGPLTSLLLGALFFGLAFYGEEWGVEPAVLTVSGYLALLNVVLAAFNLLPGFPLDGGRLLRAVLWKFTGDLTRATRWATHAGQGLGWLLIALGVYEVLTGYVMSGLWLVFIAWFLRDAARRSYQSHLAGERVKRARSTIERIGEIEPLLRDRDRFVIPDERLPPGFAQTVEQPPDEPPEPRPAATVVLVRDGAAGLEVLLLRRHRSSGFVPGAYVFPGGRVDEGDADRRVLERVRGLPAPAEPDLAYWIAAVREAYEETGVLPGAAGAAPPPSWRERLMQDEVSLADMLEQVDLRLDLSRVVHIAHWITPVVEPRRYDTHFFLAAIEAEAEALVDEREMTDARWLTPEEALRRFTDGKLPMVFPTVRTIERLLGYESTDAALDDLRTAPVRPVLPRLVRRAGGVGIEVPDESGESRDGEA